MTHFSFQDWILNKIAGYLKAKEGCAVSYHPDQKIIVQDVFGYRYEVSVKLLSRIENEARIPDGKYVSYERR
jgi:hypothetical protein